MPRQHQLIEDPDDRPFQHYTLKHQMISWLGGHVFDGITYTVHHGLIAGMKRKGGLAWLPIPAQLTAEQQFLNGLDLRGRVIYDIGAFQGILTLFFASRGKYVVAFEPSSKNRERLLENLELNNINNVKVRNTGLGSSRGNATLCIRPLMPGGASIEANAAEGIRRFPHVMEEISVTTLDEDIRESELPAPQFIKIDVEGLEGAVLRGALQTLAAQPALFLEMHGETMNEKRRKCTEVVSILEQAGYREIIHVESSTRITSANAALAAQVHLYCPGAS